MARTEVRGGQILDASVSLTADVTGTLPIGNGGTGNTSNQAASCTGNAATATALQTARTINGVSFDGSANIRLRPPYVQVSNTTSWTIDSDTYEYAENTGLTGNLTINNPTGTPTPGQRLWVSVTGTAARTITHGSAFEASTTALPTTTVTTARLDIGYVWNAATSKWRCVAVS